MFFAIYSPGKITFYGDGRPQAEMMDAIRSMHLDPATVRDFKNVGEREKKKVDAVIHIAGNSAAVITNDYAGDAEPRTELDDIISALTDNHLKIKFLKFPSDEADAELLEAVRYWRERD